MRIACVGGGPGGLHLATLLKSADPRREVVVFERNRPEETFGFGVVFSRPTLDDLQTRAPPLHALIERNSVHWNEISLTLAGRTVRLGGQGFSAISRRRLLSLLHDEARGAGVDLRFGAAVEDVEDLEDYDLVVGSDGASSAVRRALSHDFRPVIEVGKAKYIWFGTTRPFECLTFFFEKNEHGSFAVHAYPFDRQTSTFIVETDEASWRAAGFDAEVDPDKGSDERARAYCERLFAGVLDGHPLLTNRSRWKNFRTITVGRWWRPPFVLVGDAAHTTHFSVGSGTKLAFEDALSLHDALREHDDISVACEAYEARRRIEVERLQSSATPSLAWWEGFRHTMDFAPEQFAFHFLTRNMRVTRDSVARRDPEFCRAVDRWFAESSASTDPSRATSAPLVLRELRLRNRIVCATALSREPPTGYEDSALLLFDPGPDAPLVPTELARAAGLARAANVRAGLVLSSTGGAPELEGAWTRAARVARESGVEFLELWSRAMSPGLLDAVRAAWPATLPLSIRFSSVGADPDGAADWARPLVARSDLVSVVPWVPGGVRSASARAGVAAVVASDRIRNELHIRTMLVGSGGAADTGILAGRADLFLIEDAQAKAQG